MRTMSNVIRRLIDSAYTTYNLPTALFLRIYDVCQYGKVASKKKKSHLVGETGEKYIANRTETR